MERLQKVIASSGYTSRRKAEKLIEEGKVKVNGKVIDEMGFKVNKNDIVEVEGLVLKHEDEKLYYVLNKPSGVITSTSDDKDRKTVVDLIKTNKRIYPVGRLDYDTTGILLLTNDGELANKLMHPKSNIDKIYIAKVRGLIGKKQLGELCRGVLVDGKMTSKLKLELKNMIKKQILQ